MPKPNLAHEPSPLRVNRGGAARSSTKKIWNYLAEHASFDVADQVIADIEAGIERVVESPGFGHTREDLTGRKLLFYLVHSYLIVYRPTTKPLHIIRVLHAARDVKKILTED